MTLWTGMILGFLGSVHCLGMCGPLALALPGARRGRAALIVSRLFYNAGRTLTYTAFGVGIGALGEGLAFAGLQRWLSIAAGVALLIAFVAPASVVRKVTPTGLYLAVQTALQKFWGSLSAGAGGGSLFVIGALNGALPCGFVYLALAGAASVGSIDGAATFMFGFGIGTIPAMLTASLVGGFIQTPLRQRLSRLLPIAGATLAALLILRGLSLGIPYLSPKIAEAHTVSEAEPCH
ncbi:MAG TPA: sulfite exporter TauE/SafE family protein [candidate division Zixibacteria bacterium]|nr:sulfite exporter TauE/SafE family protein [candidate division Zixibacteria bacterium]